MTQADPTGPAHGAFEESEVIEYQAVSGLAVGSFLAGLLSPGAVLWPLLWIAPPLGILLGVLALKRIADQPSELTGKRLALVGLALSVFFAAMVPTERLVYRQALARQAREFATIWFDCLRNDEPIKAYQLSLDPRHRLPMARLVDEADVADSDARANLEEYVQDRTVRCLLALGDKARARHYATEQQEHFTDGEIVITVYAVTYQEGGRDKTFFIRLALRRYELPDGKSSDWQVAAASRARTPSPLCAPPLRNLNQKTW